MKNQEEFNVQMEEFRKNLTTVFFKSQEEFEKRLSFISAAGFGASVFLIENVVGKLSDSLYIWVLVLSWSFLGGTLILNLISHVISANKSWATLNDILNDKYSYKVAAKRQKLVKNLNYICIGLLFTGLILLILFFKLNLNKKMDTERTSHQNEIIQKGYISSPPPQLPVPQTGMIPTPPPTNVTPPPPPPPSNES